MCIESVYWIRMIIRDYPVKPVNEYRLFLFFFPRVIYISHTPFLPLSQLSSPPAQLSYPHFIARRVNFRAFRIFETSGNFRKLRFPFYPLFFPSSFSPIFLNFLPSLSFPFSNRISYTFSPILSKSLRQTRSIVPRHRLKRDIPFDSTILYV